jgi:hypothetical protein
MNLSNILPLVLPLSTGNEKYFRFSDAINLVSEMLVVTTLIIQRQTSELFKLAFTSSRRPFWHLSTLIPRAELLTITNIIYVSDGDLPIVLPGPLFILTFAVWNLGCGVSLSFLDQSPCYTPGEATNRKVAGSIPSGVIDIILPAALWS